MKDAVVNVDLATPLPQTFAEASGLGRSVPRTITGNRQVRRSL